MKQFFPVLEWLPGYRRSWLGGDVVAGLTVGIMLVPQGMAYAMIAGLPVEYGLYASLVPQIVYALTGTSRQLAVGPVAMDSLLVASGLAAMGTASLSEYVALAVLLSLLMGTIQLVLGLFKMGFLVNFLSRPVISGFTSAAALIIGLNQLKYLFGIDVDRSNRVQELVLSAVRGMDVTDTAALGIGLAAIGVLLVLKKWAPHIPGALLVVVAGVLAVIWGGAEVDVVGNVPAGLPAFDIPVWSTRWMELLPIAGTLALIAFMEAISVAKAVEERHDDYTVNPNQELRALGLANIAGAFFQAYPTTGGFSRTAVNDASGAKTGIAALISAVVVGLVLLFFTGWFAALPKTVLAAIIMVAVFKLMDWQYPIQLWKTRRDEFVLLLITFAVTAGIGIVEGIVTGALLALFFMVFRTARPHVAVLGNVNGYYKNIKRFPEAVELEDTLVVRFDGQLYYANMNYFAANMERLISEKGEGLKVLVINAEAINYIDATAGHRLHQLITEWQARGIRVVMSGVIGPVRDALAKLGLAELMGEDQFFVKTANAVQGGVPEQAAKHITSQAEAD